MHILVLEVEDMMVVPSLFFSCHCSEAIAGLVFSAITGMLLGRSQPFTVMVSVVV